MGLFPLMSAAWLAINTSSMRGCPAYRPPGGPLLCVGCCSGICRSKIAAVREGFGLAAAPDGGSSGGGLLVPVCTISTSSPASGFTAWFRIMLAICWLL